MRSIVVLAVAALGLGAAGLSGCALGARSVVQAPDVCQDINIPIYFSPDGARITPDGQRLITAEARRARQCTVDSVRVLGLADAAGEPEANLELSRRRAASVAEAIAKAGLPAAEFEVAAAGEAGAITTQGKAPVRRRADVTLKLSKPK